MFVSSIQHLKKKNSGVCKGATKKIENNFKIGIETFYHKWSYKNDHIKIKKNSLELTGSNHSD